MKETPDQMLWVQTSSRATVDGADLKSANTGFDQQNQPVVNFTFNISGAERFGKLTSENVDKRFAIILDDKVVSAPVIRSPIIRRSGQGSGHVTVPVTTGLAV